MELGDRLGAAWDVPRSGMGDVVGVDPTLRRLFSQRSAAIDEYVAGGRGANRNGPARTRGAFHATRPDKDRTCTVDSLMGEWKQRAADYGFDLGDLTRVVGTRAIRRAGGYRPRPRPLRPRGAVRTPPHARPSGRGRRPRRGIAAGTRSEVIESAATNVVEAAGAPLSRSASAAVPVGRRSGRPSRAGPPSTWSGWRGASDRGAGADPGHRPGARPGRTATRTGVTPGRDRVVRRSDRRAAGSLTATAPLSVRCPVGPSLESGRPGGGLRHGVAPVRPGEAALGPAQGGPGFACVARGQRYPRRPVALVEGQGVTGRPAGDDVGGQAAAATGSDTLSPRWGRPPATRSANG